MQFVFIFISSYQRCNSLIVADFGDNLLPDLGTARRVMTKEITKSLVLAAIRKY